MAEPAATRRFREARDLIVVLDGTHELRGAVCAARVKKAKNGRQTCNSKLRIAHRWSTPSVEKTMLAVTIRHTRRAWCRSRYSGMTIHYHNRMSWPFMDIDAIVRQLLGISDDAVSLGDCHSPNELRELIRLEPCWK